MTTKLPFLLGAVMIVVTLSACRSRYEIVLANTSIVDAYSKPKLTNGFYYYKDAKGEMQALFYGRVREINRQ
jgi:hypothetical protein